jgi:CheY-like chemotaxis protein
MEEQSLRGRILLIDDERSYLRLVKALLEPYHDVEIAGDGVEAFALLEAGERFDLLLCDVTMPRLDGPGLYERVRALDASLTSRFVFVTGGAFTPRTVEFLKGVANPQIQKPFDPPTLLTKLQEWLRAPAIARDRV